jgi:F-type H+-transporting ATPase subunit delta
VSWPAIPRPFSSPSRASQGCTANIGVLGRLRNFRGIQERAGACHEIQKSQLISRAWRLLRSGARSAELPDGKQKMAGEGAHMSGMAGRYATALFELVLEEHAIDAVKADLDRFEALVTESADLDRLVRSPAFSSEQQMRALAAVLDLAGLRGLAAQFLLTVASNRRLFAMRDIIKAFRALVARHRGEVAARVTLAAPASERHLAAIRDALNSVTGKQVQVDVKIDPGIIGGLVVQLGSRMVDSSLRTKLNMMKHAMKEAS